eukprot:TRINITY_DN20090_c0_g1_i2.p1 TRINITY_DN20090_c0_g1~~TRINITY_DN20090_c0_g1_i2.p1  ORF type:complete len:701 (+),score=173.40 TRINITY_DN20090_c0_g1_i2:85-2187(+)
MDSLDPPVFFYGAMTSPELRKLDKWLDERKAAYSKKPWRPPSRPRSRCHAPLGACQSPSLRAALPDIQLRRNRHCDAPLPRAVNLERELLAHSPTPVTSAWAEQDVDYSYVDDVRARTLELRQRTRALVQKMELQEQEARRQEEEEEEERRQEQFARELMEATRRASERQDAAETQTMMAKIQEEVPRGVSEDFEGEELEEDLLKQEERRRSQLAEYQELPQVRPESRALVNTFEMLSVPKLPVDVDARSDRSGFSSMCSDGASEPDEYCLDPDSTVKDCMTEPPEDLEEEPDVKAQVKSVKVRMKARLSNLNHMRHSKTSDFYLEVASSARKEARKNSRRSLGLPQHLAPEAAGTLTPSDKGSDSGVGVGDKSPQASARGGARKSTARCSVAPSKRKSTLTSWGTTAEPTHVASREIDCTKTFCEQHLGMPNLGRRNNAMIAGHISLYKFPLSPGVFIRVTLNGHEGKDVERALNGTTQAAIVKWGGHSHESAQRKLQYLSSLIRLRLVDEKPFLEMSGYDEREGIVAPETEEQDGVHGAISAELRSAFGAERTTPSTAKDFLEEVHQETSEDAEKERKKKAEITMMMKELDINEACALAWSSNYQRLCVGPDGREASLHQFQDNLQSFLMNAFETMRNFKLEDKQAKRLIKDAVGGGRGKAVLIKFVTWMLQEFPALKRMASFELKKTLTTLFKERHG